MNNNDHKTVLKNFAQQLRKEGTKGEARLWKHVLRAKKMEGYQFNRQFIIGKYIVDFVCRKLKLIIEVDGSSHLFHNEEDRIRQDELESAGYIVLRFTEKEVIHKLDDVHTQIYHVVNSLRNK